MSVGRMTMASTARYKIMARRQHRCRRLWAAYTRRSSESESLGIVAASRGVQGTTCTCNILWFGEHTIVAWGKAQAKSVVGRRRQGSGWGSGVRWRVLVKFRFEGRLLWRALTGNNVG